MVEGMTPWGNPVRARRSWRTRGLVGLAAIAVLVTNLVAAPVLASATPEGAVLDVVAALDAGRYGAIPGMTCSAKDDEAVRRLDLSGVLAEVPAEVRAAAARTLDVRVDGIVAEVIEEEGGDALVRLTGSMWVSMDRRALRRILMDSIPPDGILDQALYRAVAATRIEERIAALQPVTTLDVEVAVAREGGEWRLCDDLGWGLEPIDPGDVCSLISPRELALVAPWPLETATPSDAACRYHTADGSDDASAIDLWVDEGSLDLVRSAHPDGISFEVDGYPGFAVEDTAWLDLGGRSLVIKVTAIGAGDVDAITLARTIAEVVATRLGR
jgi:hypothetical protein